MTRDPAPADRRTDLGQAHRDGRGADGTFARPGRLVVSCFDVVRALAR